MATLHHGPTDTIVPTTTRSIRALLDAAFEGRFTDHDWDHATGGTHVWLSIGDEVISHGSVVDRTLTGSGQTLHVGYVEAVATRSSHRRQGHGTRVMQHLGDLLRERYPLGALSTGTHAFYERLGWERWRGPTFVSKADAPERTPADDDSVMIFRTPRSPALDLDGDIVCDWRAGDVW